MGKPKPLPPRLQAWVDARKRHRLSHAHVQMARELGLNPTKLGKIDNHPQEPWKAPLPQYIEHLYATSFGRDRPEVVRSIEETVRLAERRRAERKAQSPVEDTLVSTSDGGCARGVLGRR
jgi:hypothetical protein